MRIQTPLTDEQLYNAAPSIFSQLPMADVSDRYTFIPTNTVVAQLREEGFQPYQAIQSKSRTPEGKEFAQHQIRFRHSSMYNATNVGDEIAEMILRNSHNRSSGFQLSTGLFRLACLNGMVVKSATLDDISVRHSGDILGDIIEGSYRIIKEVPALMERVGEFKGIELTPDQRFHYAQAALQIKYGEDESPVTPEQLLRVRRYEDQPADLWHTFNVVQENMIKGGLRTESRDRNGRLRRSKTRSIKSISEDTRLNKSLWYLTEHLAGLVTQ
jgi:hypothetical protein